MTAGMPEPPDEDIFDPSTLTIALVDDDRRYLGAVFDLFHNAGYVVETYDNCLDALDGMIESPPDMAILDVMMGENRMNGLALFERLQRERVRFPVIFLTGIEDIEAHIKGLRMGAADFIQKQTVDEPANDADDYVPKSSSPRILLERAYAVLRHSARLGGEQTTEIPGEPIVRNGDLVVDPAFRSVHYRGKSTSLTVTELRILASLARYRGTRTRRQLLEAAYPNLNESELDAINERVIDSHVKRIRAKTRHFGTDETLDMIAAHYAAGYALSLP